MECLQIKVVSTPRKSLQDRGQLLRTRRKLLLFFFFGNSLVAGESSQLFTSILPTERALPQLLSHRHRLLGGMFDEFREYEHCIRREMSEEACGSFFFGPHPNKLIVLLQYTSWKDCTASEPRDEVAAV